MLRYLNRRRRRSVTIRLIRLGCWSWRAGLAAGEPRCVTPRVCGSLAGHARSACRCPSSSPRPCSNAWGAFSQYVTEAVARQLELDLLGELAALLEEEHGPVDEALLAE